MENNFQKEPTINDVLVAINDFSTAVDKRFESIDQRFESIDQRFESIDQRFESIDQRFEGLEKKMDDGFRNINARLDLMQRDLDEVKDRLNHLYKVYFEDGEVNTSELLRIKDKVAILERQMAQALRQTEARSS